MLQIVIDWTVANWSVLIGPLLWAIANEILGHNPNWASNTVIQLVMSYFKTKLPPSK